MKEAAIVWLLFGILFGSLVWAEEEEDLTDWGKEYDLLRRKEEREFRFESKEDEKVLRCHYSWVKEKNGYRLLRENCHWETVE